MERSEFKAMMNYIYAAIEETDNPPIEQIMGYILTDDPKFITKHKDARTLIEQTDRETLLHELLLCYFSCKI